MEQEPSNPKDKNAIQAIGIAGRRKYFIGYLPKELAAQITLTGLFDKLKPRLMMIRVGKTGYIDISFDILGRKEDKKTFDAYHENKPAEDSQKEYLKFFNLTVPKGLTAGKAQEIIKDHKNESTKEEQDEWENYSSIIEDFNDEEFLEEYELKKVPISVLHDAITQVRQEYDCYSDFCADDVVDKLIEIRPDLKKTTNHH